MGEPIDDEKLQALLEMSGTVAVKGPLLRAIIDELRARREAEATLLKVVPTVDEMQTIARHLSRLTTNLRAALPPPPAVSMTEATRK